MKTFHHLAIPVGSPESEAMEAAGVEVRHKPGALIATLELDEASEAWRRAREVVLAYGILDMKYSKFAKAEVRTAPWSCLEGGFIHGYPQPEDDYLDSVYDLSEYCAECGVGARQESSFVMKAEPKWGRNGILQMNWSFSHYFVRPEVFRELFEPAGLTRRAVLDSRGRPLESVVQLVIDCSGELRADFAPEAESTLCEACGRTKQKPAVVGWLPEWKGDPPSEPACRTSQ